jgi:dTDP-4-amino-4,6-dideoxygalactose transaminase
MTSLIQVAKPIIGDEEINLVIQVLKSGNFVQGKYVEKFEKEFAKYIGVKHAIATNSGTSAEQIILAALGIGPGDEVIVPAITFFSTATSVIHQNAIPIFADVDKNTVTLDPEDFRKKITEKTRAVVPVHLYGGPADMDPILEYAKENGIYVIEDAAQAHGAEYKGKKVGSIGTANFWSFYATKNITTIEGGLITTNDDEVARKTRIIRNHGMINRDDHIMLGYNYRMNEIQAAIGVAQLPKLDKWNEERISNSKYLLERIKDIPWIKVPKERADIKHVYYWCPFFINENKLGMSTVDLRKKLLKEGVETRHRYNAPLYKQIMLLEKNAYPKQCPFSCSYYNKTIDYSKVYCENAEKIAGKILGLPNYPGLTKTELTQIVNILHNI